MIQAGDLNTRVRVAQFENFGDGGYGGYTEETGGQGGKFVWCKWDPTSGEVSNEDGREVLLESVTATFRKKDIYPITSTNFSNNSFVLKDSQKYQIESLIDSKYKFFVEAKLITSINPS